MNAADGFSTGEFLVRLATRAETTEIQAFNEANPEYWLLTHGHPPPPDDAQRAFDAHPPADMNYREDPWFIVRDAATSALAGHVACAIDLMAPGVFHLGFFMVATSRIGTGFAQRLYEAYEKFTFRHGARWLRLGVVECNERGRAFWRRQGYVDVKRLDDFVLGERSHRLFTMVKPRAGETLDEYLAAVPRDRSDPDPLKAD
jgi:GNAT superfamily N-acetyltransferase